jgi:hypothetical protein
MSPTNRRTARAVVAALAILAVAASASADGDTSGHLGSGGTARGDVSQRPGEIDRIAIDLDATLRSS